MKTLFAVLSKMISTAAFGSVVYTASQMIVPLKATKPIHEAQIPRMTLTTNEFSPPWLALEDDYALVENDETIPTNAPSQELVAGEKDYSKAMEATKPPPRAIDLPSLSIAPIKNTAEPSLTASTAQQTQRPLRNAWVEQNQYRIPHFWLQGRIELTGGLAFTGPSDQLRVGWFEKDKLLREGVITMQQGTYELKVDRMSGEVVAELIDRKGYKLGEAIIDLDQLAQKVNLNQMMVPNVDIKVYPYDYSAGQTVGALHSASHKDVIADTSVRVGEHDLHMRTDERGRVSEPIVTEQSMAMVSTSKEHYRDTISHVDFLARPQLRIFSEKFVQILFDILGVTKSDRQKGLVWGSVLKNGEPAAGYQVRLSQYQQPLRQVSPVYFNFYIANPKLQQTSEDGQFAFIALPDGDYEAQVVDSAGQALDARVVVVRAGFISHTEFDIGHVKTIHLRPFDPLSTTKESVELATLGLESLWKGVTEEFIPIDVHSSQEPLLIFSHKQNQAMSSSTWMTRQKKYQDIPVLNEEWWQRVQQQNKINNQKGVIIGFVDSTEPFEVFVENSTPEKRIIYFDHSGKIVEKTTRHAGFVIYNMGLGLKTLILQTPAGRLHTETAYLDGESVALIYKSL